jgi:hypothetical protein
MKIDPSIAPARKEMHAHVSTSKDHPLEWLKLSKMYAADTTARSMEA